MVYLASDSYASQITLKHSGREYKFNTDNNDGVEYIKLSDFLKPSGIEPVYNRTLHKITFSTKKNTFIMSTVSNAVYADGKAKIFKTPVLVKKGVFYISVPAAEFISPSLSYDIKALVQNRIIIFLDPGHGGDGEDGLGAEGVLDGKKIYEKQVVLDFAKILGPVLEGMGYAVQYMRDDNDTKISLLERINKVNNSGAKIFISIHANSSADDKTAKGMDVFYMSEEAEDNYAKMVADAENKAFRGEKNSSNVDSIINSMLASAHIKEGAKLASQISSKIPKSVMNRGVKKAPFAVLSRTMIPSVLIELGFMSNTEDLKRITDKKKMQELAKAIAQGIQSYLSSYKADKAD